MKPFSLVCSRLLAGVVALSLCGCGATGGAGSGTGAVGTGGNSSAAVSKATASNGSVSNGAGSDERGSQGTDAATARMNIEQPQASNAANWGADKGAAPKGPSFERGRLLKRGGGAGGGNGAPSDPYAAQYPKWRLDKAAIIRSWASVSVQPVGIDAFLRTAWTRGQIHIRLALLGPIGNLREFSRTQNSVKITFQDRAGNQLKQIIVPMSELKEAPQSVNYGTPTYFVEGSLDCPLEMYEEVYQWMFEWD